MYGMCNLSRSGNGIWDSVEEAADQFVKVKEIYEPNKENEQIYQQVYENMWKLQGIKSTF